MRKLIFTGIVTAVILAPASAMAQLQFDPSTQPTKETGGWVYNAAQLMLILGVIVVILVWVGYMRWAPLWAAKRQAKRPAPPPPASGPELAPAIARPQRPSPAELAREAAEASAESVGEAPPASTAVAVAEPPADSAGTTEDVYQKTLDELLAKGVPQKVAEARAKAAAKKAGG